MVTRISSSISTRVEQEVAGAGPSRRTVVAAASAALVAGSVPLVSPTSAAAAVGRTKPVPFRIAVPPATLARVRERVVGAHLPVTSAGAGWRYGVDAQWFRSLLEYWGEGYDWRVAAARLNRVPQYVVDVDGRDVHFAHLVAPPGPGRRAPILLLHGWPYTFATMLPLAGRLCARGFDVVVPSLPGYAFSAAPEDRVSGLRAISRRMGLLMTEALGYDRYLVHGGDFGAVVGDWLSLDIPDRVIGFHCNMIALRHAGGGFGSGQTGVADPTPQEVAYVRAEVENIDRESAYFRLQNTRPETVAYALTDSPAGWAAYMLDKWQKWTDTSERPFPAVYSPQRLLTEVMLYLVTDSVATSIWPYAAFGTETDPLTLAPGQRVHVPFAFSWFPDPLFPRSPGIPRTFVEHSHSDIRLWRVHERGGHFPMLEAPDVLADDIVTFADMLR